MDFCFNLVSIFLILDVVFIRSSDGFPKNLNKVQLSLGVGSNPFLQLSVNVSNAQNWNPFLQPVNSNNNGNGNPFLSNSFTSPTSIFNNNYNPTPNSINNLFPNIINNPFLNPPKTIDTRFDTNSSSSPRPDTQSHYTPPPPPHYPTISTSNISVFNTPTPVDNDFTTSPTHTPPKIHPPISRPSLEDLIPIKISAVKTISELKCDEYVGEIAGTTSITSLTGSSSAVIKVNNVCENTNRLRVDSVGGIEAQVGEFPHYMVALRRSGSEFILLCDGTLISHTWVLSAAHCSYGPDGGPTHARIGFHRLADQEGVTIAVKNTTRHPDYKPPAMYADIALVQLVNNVMFSTSVQPACLYQQFDNVPRKAWVSGWGVTEYGETYNYGPEHAVGDSHSFLQLEVRAAQNISICKYIIESIPDLRGSRIPKDLEHVRCINSSTYCCVQTYKIIEVSYGNGDKETMKLYVGCVCAQNSIDIQEMQLSISD